MTFGEKLKLVRTGAEERQEDLGESIGITKRTIILYEQGERTPRDDKVYEALSKHYNTPVEFWKEDKEDDPDKIEEYSRYRKTRNAARKLIDDAQGLFAGGSLSDEDKYKVIKALEQTFWKVEEKIDGNPFD